MTDWQMAGVASFRQSQPMELSGIIAQLATANQQLAIAHNASLARIEALQAELLLRKTKMEDEEENDEENRRKLETRLTRLENFIGDKCSSCRNRQRNLLRQEKENKLRWRIERLESFFNLRETNDQATNDQTSRVAVPEETDQRNSGQSGFSDETCRVAVPEETDQRNSGQSGFSDETSRVAVPEETDQRNSGQSGFSDETCRVAVPEETDQRNSGQSGFSDETCRVTVPEETDQRNSKTKTDKGEGVYRNTEDDFRINLHETQSIPQEENLNSQVTKLLDEVQRLRNDRSECQRANRKILSDLDERTKVLQELQEKFQISQARCEETREILDQRNSQYERLLTDVEEIRREKETALARVSSLEENLEKLQSEKQVALAEVQRLTETLKTDEKDSNEATSTRDLVGNSDEAETGGPTTDRATNMELFKKELTLKREARQRAIAAVSSEMERLRQDLEAEKEAHSETTRTLELLKSKQTDSQGPKPQGTSGKGFGTKESQNPKDETSKRFEAERLTSVLKVSDELRNDIRLQIEKVDDLRYQLESEPEQNRYRIHCLTETNNRAREALVLRERQTNKLKDQLAQILVRLGDRNLSQTKEDLSLECDRQLEHVNSLKSLYNERLKVLTELKDNAIRELVDVRDKYEHSAKKVENLEEDLKKAEEKVDNQDSEISNLESQLGLTKADCRDLQNQMSLINSLFTQMLLGASSADMNLDRLTQLLQENHELISEIAREEGTEAAALPKLLLDLVEQVEGTKEDQKKNDPQTTSENCGESEKKDEENIAHNLPKVWRVLLELLSCHDVATPSASITPTSDPNSCYKSVDTPAGPRLVISVSKTYIRLKELILEKKHLEKEMTRMKQLNCHLESKLGEQERRLSMVSVELSKTWNIVGRMQAQHQQLHTHEKILRYELQQKRKMLQELKQELEYCREKWESARQKNTNTEIEWRSLRREFAERKAMTVNDSFNNSGESGFSDERGDETDEEDEREEKRIVHGTRRRSRKDSTGDAISDTESERPTDTELSESKNEFSMNLENRTPTPDTDTELDDAKNVFSENFEAGEHTQITQEELNETGKELSVNFDSEPSTDTQAELEKQKTGTPDTNTDLVDARNVFSVNFEAGEHTQITQKELNETGKELSVNFDSEASTDTQAELEKQKTGTPDTNTDLVYARNVFSENFEAGEHTQITQKELNETGKELSVNFDSEPSTDTQAELEKQKTGTPDTKINLDDARNVFSVNFEAGEHTQVTQEELNETGKELSANFNSEPSTDTQAELEKQKTGTPDTNTELDDARNVFSENFEAGEHTQITQKELNETGKELSVNFDSEASTDTQAELEKQKTGTPDTNTELDDARNVFSVNFEAGEHTQITQKELNETGKELSVNIVSEASTAFAELTKNDLQCENQTRSTDTESGVVEIRKDTESNVTTVEESPSQSIQRSMNPLDEALTNVIQNLIGANETVGNNNSNESPTPETLIVRNEASGMELMDQTKCIEPLPLVSVFSIGPLVENQMETKENSNPLCEVVFGIAKSRETESGGSGEDVTIDPSTSTATEVRISRTPEEVLASREDRLKRLEEQADWLMKKMNATSRRGSALSSRLEELHQVYGEPPVPPPMPDVLPNRRLPTVSQNQTETPSNATNENTDDKI